MVVQKEVVAAALLIHNPGSRLRCILPIKIGQASNPAPPRTGPLVDSHIGVCIRPLVILDSHLKGPVYNSLWVHVALL